MLIARADYIHNPCFSSEVYGARVLSYPLVLSSHHYSGVIIVEGPDAVRQRVLQSLSYGNFAAIDFTKVWPVYSKADVTICLAEAKDPFLHIFDETHALSDSMLNHPFLVVEDGREYIHCLLPKAKLGKFRNLLRKEGTSDVHVETVDYHSLRRLSLPDRLKSLTKSDESFLEGLRRLSLAADAKLSAAQETSCYFKASLKVANLLSETYAT
jgi:hypothetical protein